MPVEEPEVKADIPPPVEEERCKIDVKGAGPRLIKAAVKADSGVHVGDIDPETGRSVEYSCPEAADRRNVELNAINEDNEIVHWKKIQIGDDRKADVVNSQRQEGTSELSDEEREELARHGIRVVETEPEAEVPPVVEPTPAAGGKSPAAKPATGRVDFWPDDLVYLEIKLTGAKNKTFKVKGHREYELPTGRYQVFFKDEPGADVEWQKAGTLQVDRGVAYEVRMSDGAKKMKVKRK